MELPDSKGSEEGKKQPLDLIILLLWSVAAVLGAMALPDGNMVRIILGIPLIIFIPGYSLVAVLWPDKGGISNLERIALSFGLSIVIVSILGLILNFLPSGIILSSILASIFLTQILLTILAYYQRNQLPDSDKFVLDMPALNNLWPEDKTEKTFVLVIVVILVLSSCALAYVLLTPSEGEKYTELYILDSNGTTENYPVNMTINDTATILVGIKCHEYRPVNYRIVIGIENASTVNDYNNWTQTFSFTSTNSVGRDITLDHGWVFEENISFNIPNPGRYKVVWQLFIDGELSDYEVHLWVDVNVA